MLKLHIAAVGRLKAGPEHTLLASYQTRLASLGAPIGISSLSLREVEAPKSLTGKVRQDREAALLIESLPAQARLFVMDERGKSMTSLDWSKMLEQVRDNGDSDAVFLIGGADGHGDAVNQLRSKRGATALSLGPNTWPHMLLRVMLAEQLYRTVSILAGHPYHRE